MKSEKYKDVRDELREKIKKGKTWEMTEHEVVMSYIFVEATELERQGEIKSASEVFEIIEEKGDNPNENEDTALEILRKRFAKGEISEEEFKEKKDHVI